MILQALVKRYDSMTGTDDAVPYGWAIRDAVFALDLDENGVLHGLLSLEKQDGEQRIRPQYLLPSEPVRSSGFKPAFLCDTAQYFFGLAIKNKSRGEKCFAASKQLHVELLSKLDQPIANGIRRFFQTWKPEEAMDHPAIAPILLDNNRAKAFYQGRFVMQVNGRYAQDSPEMKQVWDETLTSDGRERIRCLITGEWDAIETLHKKITVHGVKSGSVPLISVNQISFSSYGKSDKDPAAQIGKKAAHAYASALNALLKDETHHKRLGKDTLVYWSDGNGEAESSAFTWIGDPKEEDNLKLDSIMVKYRKGERLNIEKCNMDSAFYHLCLSPNSGRISVRFFHQSSFEKILSNNLDHYRQMEIVMPKAEKFPFLPPWILLSETTREKQAGSASPLLGGQLMHSIISGEAYPRTLYTAILTRIRAGERVNRNKAAIIKAVLLRNFHENEVATVALNELSDNIPYNLGRLFAVLERLQQRSAKEQLNTTIRDRYFPSACANPGSVFPTILKLSMHHIAKLDNPVFFEKLKGELISRLEAPSFFPASLNLMEQGQFIIGYYHQMQDLFTSRKDKEETNNV